MGLGCWIHNEKLRLLRINAPEVKGESRTEGLAARQYLRTLLAKKEIVIETYLDDKEKFGRILAGGGTGGRGGGADLLLDAGEGRES